MSKDPDFEDVTFPIRTPFQHLAAIFHQDYDVMFPNFDEGLSVYYKSLTDSERTYLHLSVKQALKENADENSFLKSWRRAGAEWVPTNMGLRDKIYRFFEQNPVSVGKV